MLIDIDPVELETAFRLIAMAQRRDDETLIALQSVCTDAGASGAWRDLWFDVVNHNDWVVTIGNEEIDLYIATYSGSYWCDERSGWEIAAKHGGLYINLGGILLERHLGQTHWHLSDVNIKLGEDDAVVKFLSVYHPQILQAGRELNANRKQKLSLVDQRNLSLTDQEIAELLKSYVTWQQS